MNTIDLTSVQWERNLTSYTSGGAYLKASVVDSGVKNYLKLSNYDDEHGFDNGVSFFAPLTNRQHEIEAFDVLSNNITNNDFGTRYLEDNLRMIKDTSLRVPEFDLTTLEQALFSVFGDDEGFPEWHRNKVLELITKRTRHAQEVLDSR